MAGLPDIAVEYDLPPEAEAWRQTAYRFAHDVLAPTVQEADRRKTMHPSIVPGLGAAGLIGASLAKDVGGGGASTLAACAIAEEIGAVDGSARGFLAVQGGLVLCSLTTFGTDEQRARWVAPLVDGHAVGACGLTEPEAGSDLGGMRTTIEEDGDEVVINGE